MSHQSSPIDFLLTEIPEPVVGNVDTWWPNHRGAATSWPHPFDAATVAAFGAETLGWAFASGYREALRALFAGRLDDSLVYALGVTEDTGNTPRAIQTRLDGTRLTGTKTFVTMGSRADRLIVLADRTGPEPAARKDLVLVIVDPNTAGVAVQPLPPTPFVPEIPHARIIFSDAESVPDELLLEDAWDDWVKPFRTVEDTFVFGATLSWLLRLARQSGQTTLVPRLVAVLACARELSFAEPRSTATHLVFAGLEELARLTIDGFDWSMVGEQTRVAWERDRDLLRVAGKARAARLERALQTL